MKHLERDIPIDVCIQIFNYLYISIFKCWYISEFKYLNIKKENRSKSHCIHLFIYGFFRHFKFCILINVNILTLTCWQIDILIHFNMCKFTYLKTGIFKNENIHIFQFWYIQILWIKIKKYLHILKKYQYIYIHMHINKYIYIYLCICINIFVKMRMILLFEIFIFISVCICDFFLKIVYVFHFYLDRVI